jgi:hypothetical protein
MSNVGSSTTFLDLQWPQFAVLVASEMQSSFVKGAGEHDEWMDEFVVRQVLRDGFARLGLGLEVQEKEPHYQNSKKRYDLRLGKNLPLDIALEIKSDPFNVQGVKDDWEKICNAAQKYRLVIFAGVTQEENLKNLKKSFSKKDGKLTNGVNVHEVTMQDTLFGTSENRHAAFIWIWSVGESLPRGFEVKLIP